MSDSKWIAGLEPDMPVADAARKVLEARLGAVAQHLSPALLHAEEDPEHVHQLRVSTRRAAAAVRIFKDCLPQKRHKQVRKYLRKLRRSAGQARDWDVFLSGLGSRLARARAPHKAGLDFLIGLGQGQRLAAQDHLVQAGAQIEEEKEVLQETLQDLHGGDKPDRKLIDQALPVLHELLDELDKAAQRDLQSYENLHQVRIQGKRLRYAMEVFAACFQSGFRTRIYPAMEEMQEILGGANDSFVACQRLQALRGHLQITQPKEWKRWQAGIEGLIQFHERRLPRHRRLFEQWWRNWHGSRAARDLLKMVGG